MMKWIIYVWLLTLPFASAHADNDIMATLQAGNILPPVLRQCKEDSDCTLVSAHCLHLGKWGWYAVSTSNLAEVTAALDNQNAISCTPPESLYAQPKAGCNAGACAILADDKNCLLRKLNSDDCAVTCSLNVENGSCEPY